MELIISIALGAWISFWGLACYVNIKNEYKDR